jgi:hypothetical protein
VHEEIDARERRERNPEECSHPRLFREIEYPVALVDVVSEAKGQVVDRGALFLLLHPVELGGVCYIGYFHEKLWEST